MNTTKTTTATVTIVANIMYGGAQSSANPWKVTVTMGTETRTHVTITRWGARLWAKGTAAEMRRARYTETFEV